MKPITSIDVDLSYLQSVTGGDKAFEKKLLTSAITDIQKNMYNLETAWQQQNPVEVRSAAHSLKSVTAIAGLPQLERLCQRTDSLFKDGIFHTEEAVTVTAILNGWMEAKPKLEQVIVAYC